MKDERLAEIAMLQQGLTAAWPTLSKYLIDRITRFTSELVQADNSETRGRIKELASLLELPQGLQDEAITLRQPPQESEFP